MAKSKSDVKDIKDRLRQASTTTTKKQIKEYKVPEKKPAPFVANAEKKKMIASVIRPTERNSPAIG